MNKKSEWHLLEDKYEAYCLLKPYYKRECIKIATDEDYPLFLDFIKRHPSFVLKPLGLHDTYGVAKIDTKGVQDLHQLFISMLNIGESYKVDKSTVGYYHNSAILEEIIIQDENFGLMSPKSLNGIRLATIRRENEVSLFNGWFKLGVTDELIVGESRDALMVGFNMETGVLDTDGFYENGDKVSEHPVSHIPFKGFQLPKWHELKPFITEVAKALPPTINYVGWDLTLTPEGWCIIEGNFWGQQLWQVVYERGFKKELEELLGWHMDENKPWWQYKQKQLEKEAGLQNIE